MANVPKWEETEEIVDVPRFEDTEEIETAIPESNEMGIGEAVLTGLGEGATFGLGPILAGAAGAAGEVVEDIGDVLGLTTDAELRKQGFQIEDAEPGLEGLLKAYYESRDIARRQQERAFEDQPAAAIGGAVLGSIPSTIATGGLTAGAGRGAQAARAVLPRAEALTGLTAAQKAAVGAREGLKAGALAGFGGGEARLAEGEIGEAAAETVATGLGGAAFGAGVPLAGAAAKRTGKFLKELPAFEAPALGYKAGRRGIDIGDDEQVVNYIQNVADDVREVISQNFRGASKQQLLEEADELGVRVAAGEPIEDIINKIKEEGGFGEKARKELGQFVEDLKSLSQSYDPDVQKAISNVEKQAARKALGVQRKGGEIETVTGIDEAFEDLSPLPERAGRVIGREDKFRIPVGEGQFREGKTLTSQALLEGEVPLKQYDLENMKLSELDEVIRKIGQRGFEGQGDAAVPFAKELYGRLRQASNEALETSSLPERNRRLKQMFNALEALDIDPKNFFSTQETVQDEVQKKIFQKITSGSLAGDLDIKNFMKYLGRADERLAEQISEKASFAKDLGRFVRTSEGEGSVSPRVLLGPVQRTVAKVGGLAGSAVRSAAEAKSAIFKRMGELTPEEVLEFGTQLSERYGGKAEPFVNALRKASEAEGARKNALMYGIYQQPAFRRMLEDVGREAIGEEENYEESPEFENTDALNNAGDSIGREPQGVEDVDEELMSALEGNETRGYIPTRNGEAIGQSGVTIAGGLDLGQRGNLDDINISDELKRKFEPYLGLKRGEAQQALEAQPLEISPEEVEEVNRAVKEAYFNETSSEYERITGRDINELPAPVQTVLFSLKYNTGQIGPKTARLAVQGKYDELAEEVRNWHGNANVDRGIINRRQREAEYLQKQLEELRRFRENIR